MSSPPTTGSGPVLVARDVSKTFFGNKVLHDFGIEMVGGTVHALLGHNGSGKSTFAKILAGFHDPEDDGRWTIEVDGRSLKPGDPESTRDLGIRFVHQELGLIDKLTVLENLRLGGGAYVRKVGGRIDWKAERILARQQLDAIGLRISPEARFDTLTRVQQSEVAIARAVQDEENTRVLVLDEPTAALPDAEVHKLYGVIERIRARGIAVLYVSHRLDEVKHLADDVSVLRNGVVVGQGPGSSFSKSDLVDLIIGSPQEHQRKSGGAPPSEAEVGEPVLQLEGIHSDEIDDLSFEVRAGEIVGIAGLVGSGVHEISRLLSGQVRPTAGTVRIDGDARVPRSPRDARSRGLVVLSARRSEKLIQEMTVKENLTLTSLRRYWRRAWFQSDDERREAKDLVRRFHVKCESVEDAVRTLSGGNQQKVAVARSLQSGPRVLALDEPTQGVDVGGKAEILALLKEAAGEGLGVLVCSSDLEELEGLCTRVLVVRSGQLASELRGTEINQERILSDCYGS